MIDDDEDDEDYDERTAARKQNGHRKQNGTTPGKRGRPRKYLRSEDEQPAENEDDENDELADDHEDNEGMLDLDSLKIRSANCLLSIVSRCARAGE